MVDVDGVVVHATAGDWARTMEADLGFSRQAFQQHFFMPHWNDVVLGRAGLHERLAPVLAEHAPHLTSQQLAAYWFEKDAVLNEALLTDLATFRVTGVQLHLATIQEHERAAFLWNTLGLRNRFDAMHYAADVGWKKTDPQFYATVEARTGFRGRELLLLDDTLANIEAARAAGWRGAIWDGTRSLTEVLRQQDG